MGRGLGGVTLLSAEAIPERGLSSAPLPAAEGRGPGFLQKDGGWGGVGWGLLGGGEGGCITVPTTKFVLELFFLFLKKRVYF